MKWEKNTAADIVMGAAAKLAEDMVHGTIGSIKDMTQYHAMFKSMSMALDKSVNNLNRHLLNKKWTGKKGKADIRSRINQIKAINSVCQKIQARTKLYIEDVLGELNSMEINSKLSKIVSRIEENTD